MFLSLSIIPTLYIIFSFIYEFYYLKNKSTQRKKIDQKNSEKINFERNKYALWTQNISKTFQSNHYNITALNDVSLKIENGHILGLLGQNGAGKTTFINILIGILEADHGDLFISDMNAIYEMDKIYQVIGVCP